MLFSGLRPIVKRRILKLCPVGYIYDYQDLICSCVILVLCKYHLFDTQQPIYLCAGMSLNNHLICVIQCNACFLKTKERKKKQQHVLRYIVCTGCVCSPEYRVWLCIFGVSHLQHISPLNRIKYGVHVFGKQYTTPIESHQWNRVPSVKYEIIITASIQERRKEMIYLTTHSTHFIYGYMSSDI